MAKKNQRKLKVLIACEESQTACIEFRKLGHEAYSCDLQECSGGHPEWHLLGDVRLYLHAPFKWDLIIAHPPCTYLSCAGANLLYDRYHNIYDHDRFHKMKQAAHFFMELYQFPFCKYIAVENPRPMKIALLPKHSQTINPYEFGDPYCKRTLLWLKNLPPLMSTIEHPIHGEFVFRHSSGKLRSKSFQGIAKAMAEQWSQFILSDYEKNRI